MKITDKPHIYFKSKSVNDAFKLFSDWNGSFWSEELIDDYLDSWDWNRLSSNTLFFNTVPRIKKYEIYLNFNRITQSISNRNVDEVNTIEIIDTFKHKLNWEWLCEHYSLINSEFIEDYEEYIHWDCISSNSRCQKDLSFIEKFAKKLNWNTLSSSHNFPFSETTILQFKDLWNWKILICNPYVVSNSENGFYWKKEFVTQIQNYLPTISILKNSVLLQSLVKEECYKQNIFEFPETDKDLYLTETVSVDYIINRLL